MAPAYFTPWVLGCYRRHQVDTRTRQQALDTIRYLFVETNTALLGWHNDESGSKFNVRQYIYVTLSNSIYFIIESMILYTFALSYARNFIVPMCATDVDLMELIFAYDGIPITEAYEELLPPFVHFVKISASHDPFIEPAESGQQDEDPPLTTDKHICEVEVMIFVSCDVMCGWLAKHLGLLHFEEIFEDMRRPSQMAKLKNLRMNEVFEDPLHYYITRKLFTGLNSVCVTSSLDVWKRARANYKGILADKRRANSMSLNDLLDFTNCLFITWENCFQSNIEAVTKVLCLALGYNIAIPINYQVDHRRMVTVNVPITAFLHFGILKDMIRDVVTGTTQNRTNDLTPLFDIFISNLLR